jgi:hypothetical protein
VSKLRRYIPRTVVSRWTPKILLGQMIWIRQQQQKIEKRFNSKVIFKSPFFKSSWEMLLLKKVILVKLFFKLRRFRGRYDKLFWRCY